MMRFTGMVSSFRYKGILVTMALLISAVCVACITTKEDPGCGWINEEDVSKYAQSFAASSQDGSITGGHVRSMNTWLQELFQIGSCGGKYPERGVKAMEVFKKAYFKADGDKDVWLEALHVRRTAPVEKNDRYYPSVIPLDYR